MELWDFISQYDINQAKGLVHGNDGNLINHENSSINDSNSPHAGNTTCLYSSINNMSDCRNSSIADSDFSHAGDTTCLNDSINNTSDASGVRGLNQSNHGNDGINGSIDEDTQTSNITLVNLDDPIHTMSDKDHDNCQHNMVMTKVQTWRDWSIGMALLAAGNTLIAAGKLLADAVELVLDLLE